MQSNVVHKDTIFKMEHGTGTHMIDCDGNGYSSFVAVAAEIGELYLC